MNLKTTPVPSLKWLYVVLLALTVAAIQACTEDAFVVPPSTYGSIAGQVFYSNNRQPIPQAIVELTAVGRTVFTDSSGNFRMDSVLAGRYTLRTSQSGYATKALSVEVIENRVQVVNVFLDDDRSINRPPNPPSQPSPSVGAVNQSTNPILRWVGSDPNPNDSLTYSVQFFREGDIVPTTIITNTPHDSLVVKNLLYNTTYYWQVVAKDPFGATTNSALWSFRTSPVPDFTYVFARKVDNRLQVFAADNTGQTAQLTVNGNNWRPISSPNREQIAFISNVEADAQLYVMNRDGTGIRRVTTVPIAGLLSTDLSFCWSPDGTQLLYPSNDKLYAIRTDGTGLRLVYQAPLGRLLAGCDWTDQGNRIVMRTTGPNLYDNELALISADGTNFKSLFAKKANRMSNPVFSVDGQQILFAYDVNTSGFQTAEGRQLNSRMHLFNIATGTLTDASNGKLDGTNDLDPRFSANGANLIFTNSDNTNTAFKTSVPPTVFIAVLPEAGSDPSGDNPQRRERRIDQAEMASWR